MVRMARPLVKQAYPFSDFQTTAHRSISEMEETFPENLSRETFPRKLFSENKPRSAVSLCAKDAHELIGGMREARAEPRNKIDVARHVQLPHFYFLNPAVFDFPMN